MPDKVDQQIAEKLNQKKLEPQKAKAPTNRDKQYLSMGQLMTWINYMLSHHNFYETIEDLSEGSGYLVLFDQLFPGAINMNLVKKVPKSRYDFFKNWDLLNKAFFKLKINYVLNTETQSQGTTKINFNFLKWFKEFFDVNATDELLIKSKAALNEEKIFEENRKK